jgi:hypothetical protein
MGGGTIDMTSNYETKTSVMGISALNIGILESCD